MNAARNLSEYLGYFRGDDSLYIGRKVLIVDKGHSRPYVGREGVISVPVGLSGWAVTFSNGDYWSYYDYELQAL